MESLIVPLLAVWLLVIGIKIKKGGFRKGFTFQRKLNKVITSLRQQTIIIASFVILFLIIYVVLFFNGFFITFLYPTGPIFPILLALITFYIIGRELHLERFWFIFVTSVVVPVILLIWFVNLWIGIDYVFTGNPNGQERYVIECHSIKRDEFINNYDVYQIVFPGVMEKIDIYSTGYLTDGEFPLSLLEQACERN